MRGPRWLIASLRTPGRVSFVVDARPGQHYLLWAETTDGNLTLSIDGRAEKLVRGPAALRYFRVPAGVIEPAHVEMV